MAWKRSRWYAFRPRSKALPDPADHGLGDLVQVALHAHQVTVGGRRQNEPSHTEIGQLFGLFQIGRCAGSDLDAVRVAPGIDSGGSHDREQPGQLVRPDAERGETVAAPPGSAGAPRELTPTANRSPP